MGELDGKVAIVTGAGRGIGEQAARRLADASRSVDLIPSQMGPWRPSPSLGGYDTPGVEGLWRSGHGTHPMSGTSAWPGRLTARTMLKGEGGRPRLPGRVNRLLPRREH